MEEKTESIEVHQATQWFVRLRAPDCSEANREEFRRWLALSPVNERAYTAVERTAELASDKRLTLDPRIQRMAADALAQPSQVNPYSKKKQESPHNQQVPALNRYLCGVNNRLHQYAAVFLLALTLSLTLAALVTEIPQHLDNDHHFVNNDIHRQRIELSDGSLMFLDVESEVAVEMTAQERRIELINGRAYFDVAHETSRPFLVRASDTRVVALGTRFEVDITTDGSIGVTLAEGSIAVSYQQPQQHTSAWRDVLRPGEQINIDQAGQRDLRAVNADAVTSWFSGLLRFDNTPLHEALDEINRYAEIKVRLSDRSLGDVSIGGSFAAGGDSSEFVRTLTTALPLKSIRTGPYEIVLFEHHKVRNSK